jgi:hypothetical protein
VSSVWQDIRHTFSEKRHDTATECVILYRVFLVHAYRLKVSRAVGAALCSNYITRNRSDVVILVSPATASI